MKHYGSEECALEAVLKGDVLDLMSVLSERQALSLACFTRGAKFGVKPEGFLATDEAKRIYQMIVSRIESYTHTDYARLKIATIFPSPCLDLIKENRAMAESALAATKKVSGSAIEDYLRDLKPLRERPSSRIRDRALAVADVDMLVDLKSRGLDKLIDLHLTESPEDLMSIADGYSHISLIGDLDSAAVEQADSLDDWYLVPEVILSYYKDNLEIITSAIEGALILQESGIYSFNGLSDLQKLIERLRLSEDVESDILHRQLTGLKGSINDAASWANSELKRRIEASSVTLDGGDILQVLSRGEDARNIFEMQLKSVFQGVLKEAKERVASELGLAAVDAVRLDDIFSSEIQYPLDLDMRALHDFEQELRSKIESRGLKARRDLARGLADKKDPVRRIINALMEFDFTYALGKFSQGMSMPEISDRPCLGFIDGRHLFLDDPQPVSYSLGETGFVEYIERVAILSGVNSGGKTSLLDLISQIAILAHMGLPVPAKCSRIGIFQELYYFSKSRGTLSAGAFETAMRKFAVVENSKRKLVMADELEAITEPGASARIIACMLDELNSLGSVAVFVSHLAEDVKRFSQTPIRVDGIEAEGLDDQFNLVVRRTPRYNYLARSTPELILDRLVRTTQGKEKEFYSRLLAKFR